MAQTRSRTTTVVTIGVAVIALATLLFVSALSINDFGQPGRGVLSGRSGFRLVLAFLLLTGLAGSLLGIVARSNRRPARNGRAGKSHAAASAAPSAEEERGAAGSGEILSDTAGELKLSVAAIEEELEGFREEEEPLDQEHLLVLYEETDRLKKIIAGMEQLSQAKEIARLARREPLQLEPLLRDVVETTRQAVPDKDIQYVVECEPGLMAMADRESIGRIMGNITDNAARFIAGSGTVTLTAVRKGGMTVLSVKDTGPGIRRAHIGHIFEHFFRGSGPGIGMGLSIVKELVDAFGGTIEVQTEVGKGTTVTIALPEA